MGISKACAELLFEENHRAPFHGSVMQLGRQSCCSTYKRVSALSGGRLSLDGKNPKQIVDDVALFTALGFDEVRSLDFSGFEGASDIADLNLPVPKSLHNTADFIFNGGTLEHVFNFPQALANIHAMLKVGGRVCHLAPTSNQIDHGLYSFSPTLFLDYYEANNYRVHTSYIFQANSWEAPWTVYRYTAGCLAEIPSQFHSVRIAGVTIAGVFFVVEKTKDSSSDVVPQQRIYATDSPISPLNKAGMPPPRPFAQETRDWIHRHTSIFNFGRNPPRVGRYG